MIDRFPCPCCGHLVFLGTPGSYEICPICYWEDDETQLLYPLMEGGANQLSLHASQGEFIRTGACEDRFRDQVRSPSADEPLDPTWRPFDPDIDPHLVEMGADVMPKFGPIPRLDPRLYYWREDYWLAAKRGK